MRKARHGWHRGRALALPEAEDQPYLYATVDPASMPVEGARVRFNFDLARADSFQATVV